MFFSGHSPFCHARMLSSRFKARLLLCESVGLLLRLRCENLSQFDSLTSYVCAPCRTFYYCTFDFLTLVRR